MVKIGIMLESQEGLTWDKLFRMSDAIEDLGFESLFLSDHLTSVKDLSKRETMPIWPALTVLALRTKRLRIGSLVCSMTFRYPAQLTKMAISVDILSGGRLDLGLGAGWYEGEHKMFGIPLPPASTRIEMFEEGVQVIKALWSGKQTTFQGKHYHLESAEMYPHPLQIEPRIIMGGSGKKALQIIAKHASEWNCFYITFEQYLEKLTQLDKYCIAIGRNPASLDRSLMIPFAIGKDQREIQKRIDANKAMFPTMPSTFSGWQEAGFFGGSTQQFIDQLKRYEAIGLNRLILEHNDLDDIESLDILSKEVLPVFA